MTRLGDVNDAFSIVFEACSKAKEAYMPYANWYGTIFHPFKSVKLLKAWGKTIRVLAYLLRESMEAYDAIEC